MELLEIVRRLVSYNTVSKQSSTVEVANFIAELCRQADFEVTPYEYSIDGLRKINLVVTKGGQDPVLALSGHMDTVPFDSRKWRTPDPLALTQEGDLYFGMGIADMKLFLAIAVKAGEAIRKRELKRPFALYFTSDEEIGCSGAKRLCQSGFRPAKYVVIGEPTELRPVNLHKGYIYFYIHIIRVIDEHEPSGKDGKKVKRKITAHSSDDRRATNVVEAVLPVVIGRLTEFKDHLEEFRDTRFDPPYPTMNIGGKIVMPEGAAKNIIPGKVTLECDLRPIPGLSTDDLLYFLGQRLVELQQEIKTVSPDEKIIIRLTPAKIPTPSMATSPNSLIVRQILAISGHQVPESKCYNTEGGVFNEYGAETVIWGPASIEQAHKENEFVHARWFQQEVVDAYVELIRRFCCEEVG